MTGRSDDIAATKITRRGAAWLLGAWAVAACAPRGGRETPLPVDWPALAAKARGETVRFLAWAGDPKINDFIAWAGETLAARTGVRLVHVKTGDTATVISQLLADKTAGREDAGHTDLVWINGENFIAAKEKGLLYGPFATRLPNWRLVDTSGAASILTDFTVPTEGYESPWGWAQLVFFHDGAKLAAPPRSLAEILAFAKARPGRFAYPAPPDFMGVTFLKQALYETAPFAAPFATPATSVDFDAVAAPLFAYLDALHPLAWRKGKAFPPDYPALRQLFEDSEIDLAFSFNPAEAATSIASGLLPATTRSYVLRSGTIRNSHFFAVPFNATAKAGALVAADFFLSPEAQARKADPAVWGDPSVLDLGRLTADARARFDALPKSPALPSAEDLARALAEPHPSWHVALEAAWRRRYAA